MDHRIRSIFEPQVQRFIEKRRPPVELRAQVDLGFSLEKGILDIFEVRSRWENPEEKFTSAVARAKYVKSRNIWKIYWMRANGNWDPYKPVPEVNDLAEVLRIIDEDEYYCFWG